MLLRAGGAWMDGSRYGLSIKQIKGRDSRALTQPAVFKVQASEKRGPCCIVSSSNDCIRRFILKLENIYSCFYLPTSPIMDMNGFSLHQ